MKDNKDKNLCSKRTHYANPYEIWKGRHPLGFDIEYRVLKKYQKPSKEKENPLARWLVAAKSEATFGTWEYGDMYVREITSHSTRTK